MNGPFVKSAAAGPSENAVNIANIKFPSTVCPLRFDRRRRRRDKPVSVTARAPNRVIFFFRFSFFFYFFLFPVRRTSYVNTPRSAGAICTHSINSWIFRYKQTRNDTIYHTIIRTSAVAPPPVPGSCLRCAPGVCFRWRKKKKNKRVRFSVLSAVR